jgi:hypothetical protein
VDDRLGTRGTSGREAIANFGEQFGASPSEIGRMQNKFDFMKAQFADDLKNGFEQMSPESKAKLKGKGGGSWLQVLADGMTKVLDASLAKVSERSTALTTTIKAGKGLKDDAAKDNQAQTVKDQQDFTVASQEFNLLMNACNTAIKTIGEGLTTMARKQ